METVKAPTTVSGHSPAHTSCWLPSGLTCTQALSVRHTHTCTHMHTSRSACSANADRCGDSVTDFAAVFFMHTATHRTTGEDTSWHL